MSGGPLEYLGRSQKFGARCSFKEGETNERVVCRMTAHILGGTQLVAHCGAIRLAEELAAIVLCQMNAADSWRFAMWHSRQR